ncbi:MAG: nucleotidyl transferase AbiEii/AbiGii toxin family protein [Planctomycetota bacterium]
MQTPCEEWAVSPVAVQRRPDFGAYVMAVERVERLLRSVAEALEAAELDYAVIGGNAVAAWVSTVDPAATRATKDVDLLVRRGDLQRIADALRKLDLIPIEVLGVHMFVDQKQPNPKLGVHLVFANEIVRPHYTHPAPDPSSSCRSVLEFRVVNLLELVVMKLQAYRRVDQVHIEDLFRVGLIDAELAATLPPDMLDRLRHVRDTTDGLEEPPKF